MARKHSIEKESVMQTKKIARYLLFLLFAACSLSTAGPVLAQEQGILKICKVAGPGVAVGTPFVFYPGNITVPAGPAPGGTCVVGPSFPVNSYVTVGENIPVGDTVTNIDVAPSGRIKFGPNLGAGSVTIQIGTGVTEVTFTNKRTGFIEICKRGHVKGNFTFFVNPGGFGPFVVPAGGCSPAIEVPAGTITVTEVITSGTTMIGCATIPVGQQGPCNLGTQTSTVNVSAGDVSAQTIVLITDGPIHPLDNPTETSPTSLPQ
jgi:hypothetical protein